MERGGAIAALIIAKLGCCVVLPLAAAGALNGVVAWFDQTRTVWGIAALILAGGAAVWVTYARRGRYGSSAQVDRETCCDATGSPPLTVRSSTPAR